MKILVIDDSTIMRKIIIGNLAETELEFEPLEATDGQNALDKVMNWREIDIILCDLIMPRMDGMGFVKELRKINEASHLPIIIITTEGSITRMEEAISEGANDYIVKPFTSDELYQRITNLV